MREPAEPLLGGEGPGEELGYGCFCEGGSSLPLQPVPTVLPQPPRWRALFLLWVGQLVPVRRSLELVPVTPVVS